MESKSSTLSRRIRTGAAVLAIGALGAGFTACGDDETEDAINDAQDSAEEIQNSVEDQVDDAQEQADSVQSEAEDLTDSVQSEIDENK
jgi:hypothetical protein